MKTGLDQNLMLAQMQRLSQLAKSGANQGVPNVGQAGDVTQTGGANGGQFGNLLTHAINTVNHLQQQSAQAATQVESGDGGASLVKAVIASQKASVAFEATVQVRNRVVSAYQDIMNMPI